MWSTPSTDVDHIFYIVFSGVSVTYFPPNQGLYYGV